MQHVGKLVAVVLVPMCSLPLLFAQDLTPRAYVITPIHSNAVILTYSNHRGEILFEGTVPITDANGVTNVATITWYHSLNFFGRSANFTATLPYGVSNIAGNVSGDTTTAYRSGLVDSVYRFAFNLRGGPAIPPGKFRDWRQRTLIGASLKVVAPTGQYDPTRLINQGTNRWAFKPEVALSRRWGHWILDAYGGVWLFTANRDFFSRNQYSSGTNTQTQSPIAAFEGHLSYDVRPRLWASLDANFWHGGATSLNGTENRITIQSNSRLGATLSVPVSLHHSVKLSYSRGAYVRFGGNFRAIALGWQYSWLGKPK
jgi:hypothetical protein